MESATTAPPELAPAVLGRRSRDLMELTVAYALILVVIWTPGPWQKMIYCVAAVFILLATWRSFPGGDQMGLRPKTFWRSLWIVAAASLLSALSIFIAARTGTLHGPNSPSMFLQRFTGYIIFACVQQALLQDFFLLRLLRVMRNSQAAAVTSATIFSLAHLPNPILTVATFVWGLIACLHFLRYRNLYTLAIAHAILGVTLAVSIPGATIHNMRVGLGYLTYNPRHLHQRSR